MERLIVKFVQTESPYRRQQAPVRVFDPVAKKFVETGQTSGKRKPSNVSEALRFPPSRKAGRYLTGLDEMIPNHLKGSDPVELRGRYGLSEKWESILPSIVKADSISRQRYYEILDGAEPDYYTSVIPASIRNSENTVFRTKTTSDQTAIERFELILYEGANVFTSETSRGRLAIQMLRNHPEVARKREMVNRDIHRFYIAEEDEEAIDRLDVDNVENDAIVEFTILKRNNEPKKLYQVAVILGLVRGSVSETTVTDQLNRFLKNKVTSNERLAKKIKLQEFLEVCEMLNKNYNLFIATYASAQALNVGAVYADTGRLIWKSQRDNPARAFWKTRDALAAYLAQELDKYDPAASDGNQLTTNSKRRVNTDVHSDNGFAVMRADLDKLGIKIEM